MKTLQESIIGRKGLTIWPNPYKLTENDAFECLTEVPLEIISLALKEMEEQEQEQPQFGFSTSKHLQLLQKHGIGGCFDWRETKEGPDFWSQINLNVFDVFYRTYTPEILRKRLKE